MKNKDIAAITAAMSDGTGLECFKTKFPERFFDVGIAEAHALTFAAGLAAGGKRPVAAIYSTFLQRGFDSIIHDIALQRLPVLMCVDRAGINCRDGVTHGGVFDVAFLSGLPGVRIYTPATFEALGRAIREALGSDCPSAVRYPSGAENPIIIEEFYGGQTRVPGVNTEYSHVIPGIGMPEKPEVVIVSHGRIAAEAVRAAGILNEKGIGAGAVLLERLTPYGETAAALEALFRVPPRKTVFLEEEIRSGGMGMLLSDTLGRRGSFAGSEFIVIALDDPFERQKDRRPMFESYGLDAESVARNIMNRR